MFHAALRWWQRDATQNTIRQAIADFFESWARVVRKTHVPTRESTMRYFGNQLVVNAAAWTAALLAARVVKTFFEVKGIRTHWGLAASRDRTLVSADDFQLIMSLASYTAGFIMLILVRHLLLRLISEFRSLRIERIGELEESTDSKPLELESAHD